MMKVKIIKLLFAILFVFIAVNGYSKNYYFDSNKGSDDNSGRKEAPWRTLKPLRQIVLYAGDKVLFAKGSRFTGGFVVNSSGTAKQYLEFSSYGVGAAPVFINADDGLLNGNVIQVCGNYIVIEGLHFAHTAAYSGKGVDSLNKKGEDRKILLVGAVYQVTEAHHLTIQYCEFEDCPIGIFINGQFNRITNNYLHDCNRYLWEPDWGPIAIFIGNANNEISYNKCINYKKEGGNYGADGGFIELDSRYFGGAIHDVDIHHNFSLENEGFLEVTNSGKHLNIFYNISNDYQQFIFFWAGDSSRVENNTVVRTKPANSTVNVVFTFKNKGYVIRNNLFLLANNLQAFAGGAYDAWNFDQLHENNIYFVTDTCVADPVGKPLGKGERVVNPKLIALEKGDYHLQGDSPAIDSAQTLGYKYDFENVPVPYGSRPDIGALEFRGVYNRLKKISK